MTSDFVTACQTECGLPLDYFATAVPPLSSFHRDIVGALCGGTTRSPQGLASTAVIRISSLSPCARRFAEIGRSSIVTEGADTDNRTICDRIACIRDRAILSL